MCPFVFFLSSSSLCAHWQTVMLFIFHHLPSPNKHLLRYVYSVFFISDFTADPKLVSNWHEFIFKDRPLRAGTAAEESTLSKPGGSASGNREDSPDHAPWICPRGETENVRPTMMSWGLREKIQRHRQNCGSDVTSRWKRFYHTKDLFPAVSSMSWGLKLTWRNIKYLQTKGGHFYGSVLTTLSLHLIHK